MGGGLLLLLMGLWHSEIPISVALAPRDNYDHSSVIFTIMFPPRNASFFNPRSWSSSSGPCDSVLLTPPSGTGLSHDWSPLLPPIASLWDLSVHSWLCSCGMGSGAFFSPSFSAFSQVGFFTFPEAKSRQSTFNQRKGARRHRCDMI